MFNQEGKLDIFENFRFDGDLPKFWGNHKRAGGKWEKKEEEEKDEDQKSMDPGQVAGQQIAFTISSASNAVTTIQQPAPMYFDSSRAGRSRFFNIANSRNNRMMADSSDSGFSIRGQKEQPRTFFEWLTKLFQRPEKEQPAELSIEDFFKAVKGSTTELSMVKERAQGYEAALKKAVDMGQTALYEQLRETAESVRAETHLFSMGHKKYIEEEALVEFVKKAKKGLRLDWVANFTRVIPKELMTLKMEMDERDIFDNYVVLHYDPNKKSYAETQAEKDRRKDPVLFGLMIGRRRLYYVGDWVDEFCDLTLDQIADTLGKEVVKEIE